MWPTTAQPVFGSRWSPARAGRTCGFVLKLHVGHRCVVVVEHAAQTIFSYALKNTGCWAGLTWQQKGWGGRPQWRFAKQIYFFSFFLKLLRSLNVARSQMQSSTLSLRTRENCTNALNKTNREAFSSSFFFFNKLQRRPQTDRPASWGVAFTSCAERTRIWSPAVRGHRTAGSDPKRRPCPVLAASLAAEAASRREEGKWAAFGPVSPIASLTHTFP